MHMHVSEILVSHLNVDMKLFQTLQLIPITVFDNLNPLYSYSNNEIYEHK
jgi:hypothetical protein